MSDLEKAREWANRHDRIRDVFHPDAKAAVEVIQSLPDRWVDAEKVREVVAEIRSKYPRNTAGHQMCNGLAKQLEGLIAPSLPTLADMTPEEREACVGMFCQFNGNSELGATVEEYELGVYMGDTGTVSLVKFPGRGDTEGRIFNANQIHLRLDLPKLDCPGSGDTPTIAQKEKVAVDQEPNDSETPKSSIKPEDVPDNDLWLVMLREEEWVGRRARSSRDYPWYIASPNGEGAEIAQDSEITLIHKLVAEPHALPEGMRLADSEEYGRIIVSPRTDLHGDYIVGHSDDNSEYGADWAYLNAGEFTYLDGETK